MSNERKCTGECMAIVASKQSSDFRKLKEWCGVRNHIGKWTCTLERGHTGDHVACAPYSNVHNICHSWENPDNPEPEVIPDNDFTL